MPPLHFLRSGRLSPEVEYLMETPSQNMRLRPQFGAARKNCHTHKCGQGVAVCDGAIEARAAGPQHLGDFGRIY